MRAHPIANILGKTITKYWNGLKRTTHDYFSLLADEWLSSVRINADTGRNFTSWKEFYGPHEAHSDTFTTTVSFFQLADNIKADHDSNVLICRALCSMQLR